MLSSACPEVPSWIGEASGWAGRCIKSLSDFITGFIDAMGYVGASLTGVRTGYLVEKFGWDAGFYFYIFSALFAAIMMVLIWIFKEKIEGE